MPKRKAISPSLRWSVFARDNFTCRYCGAQAGQDGVVLAADHLVSVLEGGDNSYDNLLTACQKCNGGKGARSLKNMPDATDVAERMKERAKSIKKQAQAMRRTMEQEKVLMQQAINLKCSAYEVEETRMAKGEASSILRLCKEFGTETVLQWFRIAYGNSVQEMNAIRYVCGIARNTRKDAEEAANG